jgi:hypothetical protein
MQVPTHLLDVDPVLAALDRGEDTKRWDAGEDAGEPDDSAEREEHRAALKQRPGRKPKEAGERFVKVHWTLPPRLYTKMLLLQRDGESESALAARLLDSHPAIQFILPD